MTIDDSKKREDDNSTTQNSETNNTTTILNKPIIYQDKSISIYPNPNNGSMQVDYTIPETEKGQFEVVDLAGRVVMTQMVAEGTTLVQINTATLEAGMYLYRLVDGNAVVKAKQMMVAH